MIYSGPRHYKHHYQQELLLKPALIPVWAGVTACIYGTYFPPESPSQPDGAAEHPEDRGEAMD